MAISNCLFSPTSENPRRFSVWYVLAKLSAKLCNCPYALPSFSKKPKHHHTGQTASGMLIIAPPPKVPDWGCLHEFG
jgi:hypothetical protein